MLKLQYIVFVKLMVRNQLHLSNSIAEVKEAIAMATGVPVEKQTLVLNGAVLSNNQAALVDSLTGFSSEVSILVLAR